MTIIAQDNFDSDTVGVIAPGWTAKVGTWTVQALRPVSGANAFGASSNGNGDIVLYTAATAIADMQLDTSCKLVTDGSKLPVISHILRSDSGNANQYAILFSSVTTTGFSIIVFKKVGGTYSSLNGDFGTPISMTLAATDTLRLRSKIAGSTISVFVGRNAAPSAAASLTLTDSSVTAAGYAGLYYSLDGASSALTIDDFALDNLAAAAATAIIVSGPSSGATGVASTNFTVSANGPITGTVIVTPSDGGAGGTFTPTTVSISSGTPTAAFTYTPSSPGAKTISFSNNGGLTNQSSLTYTAGAVSVVVAVSDANWKKSPLNWDINGSVMTAVNGGSYFRLGFTGTSVTIGIDVSSLVAGAVNSSWYPILRYSVDGGPQTDVQLAPSTNQLAITGLASGTHDIKVTYMAGWWENIGGAAPDRWTTPVYCLRITGATLDSGASTSAPAWRSKKIAVFGDSIQEGIRANYSTTQPACQNAYESAPMYLAAALDAELGNISWGGMNYAAGFNSIPAMNTSYTSYFNGRSRLTGGVFTEQPDYIYIELGANGAPAQSDVQTAVTNMRAKATLARIFIVVPVGGYGRSPITAAVAAYLAANTSETKVHLLDLGTSWQKGLDSFGAATEQAIDGLHPRSNWNARIASARAAQMQAAIDGAASPALTARTFTLSGIKIDSATLATGLTNVKVSLRDASGPDVTGLLSYQSSTQTITGGVLSFTANTTLGSGGTGWIDIKATGLHYCGQVVAS